MQSTKTSKITRKSNRVTGKKKKGGYCGTEKEKATTTSAPLTEVSMPVRVDIIPPPPANSKQPGITKSLLYNGSRFQGFQKSKGNSYEVEVVLQVTKFLLKWLNRILFNCLLCFSM